MDKLKLKFKQKKNRKKNQRKNQKKIDSTLGYPGEGPERLRMATFNVRGLKGKEDGTHKDTIITGQGHTGVP